MARVVALAALSVAALLLVSTATPATVAKQHIVFIYAPRGVSNNCAHVLPLKRVAPSPALLTGAMRALLAGPTKAERRRGYGGWLSAKTAGSLRSVRVTGGTAYVDFRSDAAAQRGRGVEDAGGEQDRGEAADERDLGEAEEPDADHLAGEKV